MSPSLSNLYSIINNKSDAKDRDKAFTFIEFIKEFGYDNSSEYFLSDYKQYLIQWANTANTSLNSSEEEFIQHHLKETLKSIIVTYSSYEEQDLIANSNWEDEHYKKAIIPFFAKKIKELCDFYKNKRENISFIINKNSIKGSKNSLEQLIYDKIIDFCFSNKNLRPQISNLKRDLHISIEQYIDIYSDYFDIPRDKKCSDATRAKFLSANINTPNHRDYIEVAKIISETIYGGNVYLKEIPLIAQVSLDLNQRCVGEAITIKEALLKEATINRVSLSDQILVRRKLYEKYLGCDLHYIYCNDSNGLESGILTKAENPSGNLLNCGNADTAVIESSNIKLLSKIGLFFKPDKTGILKINADNFTWEIDKSKLESDTYYIFPEPNKYGNIGNNKTLDYPLIYQFKLNSYIKNLSMGWAKNEPLAHISATTWNTYYSVQDNDYIIDKNKEFTYSFTSLANKGIITNYQRDLWRK